MTAERDSLNALLARNVRQCMETLKLTQRALSEQTGLDVRTIRRVRHGDGARLETVERIAEALKVRASDLIDRAA